MALDPVWLEYLPCESMVGTDEPRSDDPYLGLVIAGVFRLEELLGLGTTGRVYRAIQIGFKRAVAVKVIHRHLMLTPGIRERFHREARLAARLTHPGLVRVLASGELETMAPEIGGEVYLVSEYLLGETLRQRLARPPRLSLSESLSFLIAISDAVGDAHAHQIVHRDLKPENLMSVTRDNGMTRPVVLDFGLARALDQQQDPLTHDGAILGTPQYMSPEAARGQPATPQSDVYALATILYELLSGLPPFVSDSPLLVLMQQAEAEPAPIRENLRLPSSILRFLYQQLAKSPDRRSPNARSFAADLYGAATLAGLPSDQLLSPQLSDELLERIEGVAD